MRKLGASLALATALAAALVGAALVAPAAAQGLSPGCAQLNDPRYDGVYNGGSTFNPLDPEFAEGDHITVTAGPPTSFGGTPTQISLQVDIADVDTTNAFPGTVEYVFPAAGAHSVFWFIDIFDNATWTVSCSPAADPAQKISDLQDEIADLGLPKGLTNALNSKLRAALAKLEADHTAGACGSLQAFLNQVSAQTGKKLTEDQADELTYAANEIREQLGC